MPLSSILGLCLWRVSPVSQKPLPSWPRLAATNAAQSGSGARTTEALYEAMGEALKQVCSQGTLGCFQSCGLRATRAPPQDLRSHGLRHQGSTRVLDVFGEKSGGAGVFRHRKHETLRRPDHDRHAIPLRWMRRDHQDRPPEARPECGPRRKAGHRTPRRAIPQSTCANHASTTCTSGLSKANLRRLIVCGHDSHGSTTLALVEVMGTVLDVRFVSR